MGNANSYKKIITGTNYIGTKTLNDEFRAKIREITKLSNKINKNDNHKILEMMKDHISEIEERYNNNDEHWTIETSIQSFYKSFISTM